MVDLSGETWTVWARNECGFDETTFQFDLVEKDKNQNPLVGLPVSIHTQLSLVPINY